MSARRPRRVFGFVHALPLPAMIATTLEVESAARLFGFEIMWRGEHHDLDPSWGSLFAEVALAVSAASPILGNRFVLLSPFALSEGRVGGGRGFV
jgi:hypothetical protein